MTTSALPPVVDADTWQRQLDELRVREKAATRELDAIAAQRRRLPMVKMPDYSAQSLERSSHGFSRRLARRPHMVTEIWAVAQDSHDLAGGVRQGRLTGWRRWIAHPEW